MFILGFSKGYCLFCLLCDLILMPLCILFNSSHKHMCLNKFICSSFLCKNFIRYQKL